MTRFRITSALLGALAIAGLTGCAGLAGDHSQHVPASAHGLIALKSPHGPDATLTRLLEQLKRRNLNVAARIDHGAAARGIGQMLRPTEVVIFGNPQAGTPLMQCAQTIGIDLPMKALVWVDARGQTWLGYNDPVWLVQRHGGGDCPAAARIGDALAAGAAATVAR
jgi:uncharacterized protein (DUF302 family)